jgi:thiamine biosynthesis lipoprotein
VRLFLTLLAALLIAACARNPLHSQESYVFGTRVEVLVWGAPEDQARAAMAEVLREFDRLHRTYHAWQPSELSALNEAIAAGQPHEVSAELAGFIRDAQAASAVGDHLFDPGIGRLIALWGFHDDSFKAQLPDAAQLAEFQRARPSIAQVTVTGRRVASSNPAVALDFGGYLKGVALDRAVAILKGRGIANALINIGGNVMALGAKGSQPWRVGIQHPREPLPLATLELRDGEAIGTSGDYQRYFELDGRRYSHLLDPRTGEPAAASRAVTILIPPGPEAGMRSDAYSKPLFIAGDDWPARAARLGLTQVLRIAADGRVQVTAAFKERLKFEGSPALEVLP